MAVTYNSLGDSAMGTVFDQNLEKYAEVVLRIGLNFQPGQRLLIGAPILDALTPLEAAPLVRLIATKAYQLGASLVDILWGDDQLKRIRLQHASQASLEEFPAWQVAAVTDSANGGDAILLIYAHNPELLSGQDPERVGTVEQIAAKNTAPIFDLIGRNATNWSVISVPVSGWSAKVFPSMAPGTQDARLWDAIFEICRVNQADPIAAWQHHVSQLGTICDYLDQRQYTALKFTGSGTDLIVGLPSGHIWRSGRMTNEAGIPFTANIPTEEVFTMPHRDKTEGVVTATKPLSFGGGLIENFSLTFHSGRVVKMTAEHGEENLRNLLDTDAGACHLGEVALVRHSSPISQSGLIFYNILIDENAASHLALGHAYKFNLETGTTLSDDEFVAAGGNLSATHIDFMIGSDAVDVDGVTTAGVAEPIMRKGEWAFRA
jgi:aminopeptidase